MKITPIVKETNKRENRDRSVRNNKQAFESGNTSALILVLNDIYKALFSVYNSYITL